MGCIGPSRNVTDQVYYRPDKSRPILVFHNYEGKMEIRLTYLLLEAVFG